ncbi:MAG: phosphopantetheine-binding protein [Mycoplasmoidaceae bacterium]
MEIINEVNKILKDKNINIVLSKANLNKTFKEIGLDSLASMTVVVELEEKLGISIPDEKLAAMKTAKDLIDSIESSIKK